MTKVTFLHDFCRWASTFSCTLTWACAFGCSTKLRYSKRLRNCAKLYYNIMKSYEIFWNVCLEYNMCPTMKCFPKVCCLVKYLSTVYNVSSRNISVEHTMCLEKCLPTVLIVSHEMFSYSADCVSWNVFLLAWGGWFPKMTFWRRTTRHITYQLMPTVNGSSSILWIIPTDLYKLLNCALRRWNAARDSDILSTRLCFKFWLEIKNRTKPLQWGRRVESAVAATATAFQRLNAQSRNLYRSVIIPFQNTTHFDSLPINMHILLICLYKENIFFKSCEYVANCLRITLKYTLRYAIKWQKFCYFNIEAFTISLVCIRMC